MDTCPSRLLDSRVRMDHLPEPVAVCDAADHMGDMERREEPAADEVMGRYINKRLAAALLFILLLAVASCELDDDCPVNCESKVTDRHGNVLECICPNN